MTERRKRVLAIAGTLSLIVLLCAYASFQAKDYLLGPQIDIVEPKNYETVRDKTVTVRGKISRASFVTLNGKEIFVEQSGFMNEVVALQTGYNFVQIWVKDRFGREKTKTFVVVASREDKTSEVPPGIAPEVLEIRAEKNE